MWLVNFPAIDNLSACKVLAGVDYNTDKQRNLNMKKIILIIATLGFAATLSASAADGKTNWNNLCAKCHGDDGKGQTKIGKMLGIKDLTDPKVQAELKDETIARTIKEGVKDADGRTKMKAFDTLSDDEVKALVQYVHGLKS